MYTLEGGFKSADLEKVQSMLVNPVFQEGKVDDVFKPEFDYALER